MTQDLKAAAKRWSADEGRLAVEVVRRLQRNASVANLGLGEVDGRIDLRGLTTAPPERTPTRTSGVERGAGPIFVSLPVLRRIRFAHLDLSGARLPDWTLRKVEIADCRFDQAVLRDWAIFQGLVRDTSFHGADLRGSLIGDGTVYRSCSFEGADLRGAHTADVTFEDVRFDHANLRDVEFLSDRFVRCRFAGHLDGTMFGADGPEDALDGTDFGDAELDVRMLRLNLTGIVPPRHPDNIVVRNLPCVLDRLEAEIATDPDHPMAWMTISREMWRRTGSIQSIGIFHRRSLSLSGDMTDAEPAVATLLRLDRECNEESR